jgi:hypothetical protein
MAQQNIDFGAFPDDPSADAIRTAFTKVQNNFDQLFSTNANSTVNSINRTPGAGITVNYPTGNVVISANIACLLVATTSLKVGRGADNTQSNVTITSSSQQLNIDIDPDQVLSNTFAAPGSGLANLNGTLTSNSYYQPNINTIGTLTSLSVSGNANVSGNASFASNANFTGANINFSNISNFHIQGGTLGYYLQTDGAGNLSWAAGGGGGNGSPGGVNTFVQFNDQGNFGANLGFTFDKVTGILTVPSLAVTSTATIGNLVGALANGNSNVNIPVANGNVNISAEGNANVFVVTGSGANILGNLTVGNADLGNLATVNYMTGVLTTNAQPNITTVGTLTGVTTEANANVNVGGEVIITNKNQHGGSGYAGMITMTNSDSGATTPNKYMRLNSTGNLQIINSSYSTTIFDLSDAGALTNLSLISVTGNANVGNLNVANNAIVNGNLTVLGQATYISITTLEIQDPIISLGGGPNGAPLTSNDGKDRGTALQYYTTAPVTAFMGWDNGNAEFAFGSNVSITSGSEVVTFNNFGNIRANVYIGDDTRFGNANLGNTANANFFIGRFYGLANSATIANTVVDNAQPNITSVGTLTSLAVTGNTTSVNFVGTLANGNSNVHIAADGNIGFSATGAGNVLVVTGTGANVSGTFSASGNLSAANILGPLTNGNSNVNIPSANGNINLTSVGNTTLVVTGTGANISGTLSASGNVNAGNFVTAGLITSTGNITGGNLVTGGLISATGNITSASGVFVGNGAGLTNINAGNIVGSYGNSNVAGFMAAYGSNTITTTGNVSVGNIIGNGQALTSIAGANVTGTVTSTTNASALLQNTSTSTTAYPTFTTSSANGNSQAVINTSISANLGNASITATTFVGALSGAATSATTAGTVTTNAQGNITSVGTLTSLAVNGTVTAVAVTANTGVFTGNGSGLSALAGANVTGQVGNALVASTVYTAAQPNITSVGTLTSLSSSGNVAGANLIVTGYHIRSVGTGITAAGTTQGGGTALTKEINIVSTVASGATGVVLPTAVAGMIVTVTNTTANAMVVYPASGGQINSLGTNAGFTQGTTTIQFVAPTTTQWYTVGATYA